MCGYIADEVRGCVCVAGGAVYLCVCYANVFNLFMEKTWFIMVCIVRSIRPKSPLGLHLDQCSL